MGRGAKTGTHTRMRGNSQPRGAAAAARQHHHHPSAPMPLPSIHDAAKRGDLAEVNRLLQEDGRRLNAPSVRQRTPLMWAAWEGHDAVVARLIELGADVALQDENGHAVAHYPCTKKHASTLALLLDAGAPFNPRNRDGETPLITAALCKATECVKLLLARGGNTLELDGQDSSGWTALHWAANQPDITKLLLQAGADPTIRNNYGHTPLDFAQQDHDHSSIALLQAALTEPQRPRLLLKARALLDAAVTTSTTFDDAHDDGLSMAATQRAVLAVTPAYLEKRVAYGKELPRVLVNDEQGSEELVACLKYALGLAYGGGVHFEGEEQPVGMLREVFVELCEMLVPKWDRKNV